MQKLLLVCYYSEKPNLESTIKYGFLPDLGVKHSRVISMRMQVILYSLFVPPGLAPIRSGKKGEFRNWSSEIVIGSNVFSGGSLLSNQNAGMSDTQKDIYSTRTQ